MARTSVIPTGRTDWLLLQSIAFLHPTQESTLGVNLFGPWRYIRDFMRHVMPSHNTFHSSSHLPIIYAKRDSAAKSRTPITMKTSYILSLAPLLLLLLQTEWCRAFPTPAATRQNRPHILRAWTLDLPDNLGSFKSTWYNTVENPTARRTVYDE